MAAVGGAAKKTVQLFVNSRKMTGKCDISGVNSFTGQLAPNFDVLPIHSGLVPGKDQTGASTLSHDKANNIRYGIFFKKNNHFLVKGLWM